jgi:uncharacterized RDD family membrane protein YckC
MYLAPMENRVGFGLRLGAYVLDFVILAVVSILVRAQVAALFPDAYQQALAKALSGPGMDAAKIASARPFIEASTQWTLTISMLGVLYGLIEGFTGASPGKLILGLRAVDQSGQRASVGNLLVRYLVKYSASLLALVGMVAVSSVIQNVSQIVALIVIVGCFLVFGKARLALHDRIAGTAVLRKSDVGAPSSSAPAAVASS